MEPDDFPVAAGADEGALAEAEVLDRASAGVAIVGTRGLFIMLIGFAGSIVVARLLTPEDLGVVAIGASFVLFTGLISDGGLGAGLIRREAPPTRTELRALSGLQLLVTVAATLITVAVAPVFGRTGWVTAVMVASMPIVVLQFPGRILLERSLSYQRLAAVEVSQVLCYHGWNVGTVIAGWGVWGLATGTVVRAAVGSIAMAIVEPGGMTRPSLAVREIRPLIGFGLRFQAYSATWLARDQLLNLTIGAVGSIPTLGQWSLVRRIMEVPQLLFYSLRRVALPALPQLMARGRDPGPLIERAVGLTAVGAGFVLVGLSGGAPGLVPGVFGDQWSPASGALPWACLGMAIGGCISVTVQSYLYAVDRPGDVLWSGIAQAVALFAVTIPLLDPLGVTAVGVGWVAASVVETTVLVLASRRDLSASLIRPMLVPMAVGIAAAGTGWAISVGLGRDLWSGIVGGLVSTVLFGLGLLVLKRALLAETIRFGVRSVRAATGRGPAVSRSATGSGTG